jgi:hypothetical protein
MWRTSLGERVLRGPEWDLFREGLSSLWDLVEDSDDDDSFDAGVKAFDRLRKRQKRALLALVGGALKDERTPRPELTCPLEGTVAAVFRRVRDEVELEIDAAAEGESWNDDPEFWRRLVRAACASTALEDDEDACPDDEDGEASLPAASSPDLEAWEALVDHLANRVLWDDDDFEREDEFLDADPDRRRELTRSLRIADDYFTSVAPDPRESETERITAALMILCGRLEPQLESPSSSPVR